jgi:hypothetical protein
MRSSRNVSRCLTRSVTRSNKTSDEVYTQMLAEVAQDSEPREIRIEIWRWKTIGKGGIGGNKQNVIFKEGEYVTTWDNNLGRHIDKALANTKYQLHRIDCYCTIKGAGFSTDILQWRFEIN